jgi:hypothetical protein
MDGLPPGRYPDYPKAVQMLPYLRELEHRVASLAQAEVNDEPVLTDVGRQAVREAFKLPERFLFYNLKWPSPYFGLDVCVRWEKPMPPGPRDSGRTS